MTEKLYYKDAYQFEFTAEVLSCTPQNNRFCVVLNRSCFYPGGGGQPHDLGWLNDLPVIAVRKTDDNIFHYTEQPLARGPVRGKIDSERRLDYTQQHTGQHILSQALVRVGNYQTVSVHFGADYTTVEIDKAGVSDEALGKAEALGNEIIRQNLPVKIHWVSPAEVQKFAVRKLPPKVKKARIVEIDNFDYSMCGGTHVRRTGEVGLIKIVGQEKIRGNLRLVVKIGKRAFSDYDSKTKLVESLVKNLSCGQNDILQRVTDLQNQIRENRKDMSDLWRRLMSFESRAAVEAATETGGVKFIQKTFNCANNMAVKIFTEQVLSQSCCLLTVFNMNGESFSWTIAQSVGDKINLQNFVNPLLPIIGAKGGGTQQKMQGGGQKRNGIPGFLAQLKKKFEEELH